MTTLEHSLRPETNFYYGRVPMLSEVEVAKGLGRLAEGLQDLGID